MLCSWSYITQFLVTVILTDTYIYIFTCDPYIQTFLVWPFMPKNWNSNHSVWLILYYRPLDLKCMKWIKSTLCCDCYTKINVFFYSAQLWAQKIRQPCSIEDARTLYVHQEPFPPIGCAVWFWAPAQPASCHCEVGTRFKFVQMGQTEYCLPFLQAHTDAHLAPVAQDAMKISLAAQVMSHTVGASLNSVASQGIEHCSAFIVF